MKYLALVALTLLPAAAGAQGIAASKGMYQAVRGNLTKSAEMMPEADYAFKPVATVRSFGELIGHVADANFMICATAKGEKSPATGSYEKTTGKAALVKALNDSFAYCDPVYNMADAALSADTELFGMKMTRLGAAVLNLTHDWEHYGNVVTYLRIKGHVPPSSQM